MSLTRTLKTTIYGLQLNMHVFEYFSERTPRSYDELRKTSIVSNYKYSDTEFAKLQERDMLQHLWTGPILNASVEIVKEVLAKLRSIASCNHYLGGTYIIPKNTFSSSTTNTSDAKKPKFQKIFVTIT